MSVLWLTRTRSAISRLGDVGVVPDQRDGARLRLAPRQAPAEPGDPLAGDRQVVRAGWRAVRA